MVTISTALPCVLSLKSYLTRMLTSVRHLTGLVKVLQRSLKHHFKGMFVNVGMEESAEHPGGYPFAETLYMVSALLDPNFCLFWLDHDVLAAEDVKKKVKEKLLGKHLLLKIRLLTICQYTIHFNNYPTMHNHSWSNLHKTCFVLFFPQTW